MLPPALQCLQRLPRLMPALLVTLALALALGAAACTPGENGDNGDGNGNGSGNGNGGAAPTSVTASVTTVTTRGFTLTLAPGVPGLVPEDLTLTPSVSISAVSERGTPGTGTSYTVTTAALTPGRAHTLAITKTGYDITSPDFALTLFVTASVTTVTATGFTLTLAPGVPGLVSEDLTLTPSVSISAVSETGTPGTGTSYTVTTATLTLGQPHTLVITKTGYDITSPDFALTLSVTATVTTVTPTGFTLTLAPGVPGLVAGDLTLRPSGSISTVNVAGDASGASYTVATTLTPGRPYTLAITKTGYDITSPSFTLTLSVTATVTGLTARGFTLTLAPGVPGLVAGDLTLRPSGSISAVNVAGDASGASYTVATTLTPGRPYTLAITKTGYDISSPAFTLTLSVTARVTGLRATSFTLTLAPGVPGLVSGDLTLRPSATISAVSETSTTPGSGASYTVTTAALTSRRPYTLAITKTGYDISSHGFTTPTFVTATVSGLRATSFTLTLAPGVPGLVSGDLTLRPPATISTVRTAGSPHTSYTVTATLTPGRPYTLAITKTGYGISSPAFTPPLSVTARVTVLTSTSFTLSLAPGVPGLVAGDLTLTPPATISTVRTADTGTSYTVTTTTLTSRQPYTLAITKTGYDISSPGFTTPTFVTATVSGLSATNFTLTLAPGVPGLVVGDLTLRPPVTISTVRTANAGASYTVTAALTPGQPYTLAITKTGYNMTSPNFTLTLSVIATVTGFTETSFTLTLAPGVPGLVSGDLTLSPSGTISTVQETGTANTGARYTVTTATLITSGRTYTLAITKTGYNISSLSFTPTLPSVLATVTGLAPTGFTLWLTPGVPGLVSGDLTLRPSGTISTVQETGMPGRGAGYTVTTTTLTPGVVYTLAITKTGYTMTSPSFTRPLSVTASVTTVTPTSFTLTLAPGVPGLVVGDLMLSLSGTISAVQETGTPGAGARYAVTTDALTPGLPYTLTITKTGYNIPSPNVILAGGEANIKKMTLTVHGIEVEGVIDETQSTKTIRFSSGAYSATGPTLTGIVSLTLSVGAQVDGTNPHNTPQAYSTTAKTITVQTADGATTKTYSVTVAAYHATTNLYGVYTAAQLHAVRDGGLAASYLLMQSLTLPGTGCGSATPTGFQTDYCTKGFQPIGTESTSFTGTFDGNGHTIHNLAILRNTESHVGLFGAIGTAGAVRNLGVNMAAAGVKGSGTVGGLAGKVAGGTVSNCYAAGAVTGSGAKVGGFAGHMTSGSITNAYAIGAVYGDGGSVGGLVGEMAVGTVATSYATGAVFGRSAFGGLIGNKTSGTVTNGYYPAKRPAGTGAAGEALNSRPGKSAFANFVFDSANADWEWVDGQWPQLKDFKGAQETPSLTFHTAAVSAPSTAGFTMTLTSALSGRTWGAWALYEGTTGASIPLLRVAEGSGGGTYAFMAGLFAGKSHQLVYTQPDVIVVPASGTTIAVMAPSNADILRMTLDVDGVVLPGAITAPSGGSNGTIVFPFAQWGSTSATPAPELEGTVSLQLPAGNTVSGNLDNTKQTYTTTVTTISVTLANSTTKSYDVTVAAYNATTNPYGVYTPAQLHAVRNKLTVSYLLMQDVTLPNRPCSTRPDGFQTDYCASGWKPIGTTSAPYQGTFDGDGHTIHNLSIARSTTNYVGLFSYVSASGEIRNLGVNMATAGVQGMSYVGGLVGYVHGGTVSNCHATGAVTGRGGYIGGLAGYMRGGSVSNCHATVAVSSKIGNYLGGLVGRMVSGGTMTKSYAAGAVTGRGSVGGLLGYMGGGTITNCYATGAVMGSSGVGGLVGYMGGGTTANCYATGAVTGGSGTVGGLSGYMNAGSITDSYYPLGRPAGTGGKPLPTRAQQAAFSGFVFSGTNADWEWGEDKWPQLTGTGAVQATPSRSYHTATLPATLAPSSTRFTMTLAPPLSGRAAAHNWALYKVTSRDSTAVALRTVADTGGTGGSYTFTPTAALATGTYHLLYAQPDVIVVSVSAGPIAVTVR